jgi:hypothetical protein
VATLLTRAASAAPPPLAGSAGTDTALPLDPDPTSVAHATGRGSFSGLNITVNQTKRLVNQAISVTWTGGAPSLFEGGGSVLMGNYLQIFQCWGDADTSNPDNPGPPPENCQFGGLEGKPNITTPTPASRVYSRRLSQLGEPVYDPTQGYVDHNFDPSTTVWKPFHVVDGRVINAQFDPNYLADASHPKAFWQNPVFSYFSTNEDDFGRTSPNGTGSELFTVDTGLESPGLGCGQKVEIVSGTARMPKCWLVIVPRGTPADENKLVPNAKLSDGVYLSPLSPSAWINRIAIPLDFNPVDSPCAIGGDQRRLAGSELATPAVSSWQPTLCSTPGAPPYSFQPIGDRRARQQLLTGGYGAPSMALVSRPIDPTTVDPANPVVYAPLTLSAVTVGFNVERVPALLPGTSNLKDPDEGPLAGVRVAHLNLTPRLVAKLLTESYQKSFPDAGPNRPYATNPPNLVVDQDFVQYNPEFQNLAINALSLKGAGGLIVELPTADAAYEVWRWILADPEATAWLAGNPDPWGMKVNPNYSTSPSVNLLGIAFGNPVPDSYPKSDPFCVPSTTQNGFVLPGLCMIDYMPYAGTMQAAALETRNANDGAKTDVDPSAPDANSARRPDGPQRSGIRFTVSLTDSASAARYGLQTASLSRAGDDTANRSFVAADQAGMLAAERAMVPSAEPAVLQPNPANTSSGAYPLTMLTYAAATPRTIDPHFRGDYANFITYGAGPGQVPGVLFGQLPPGYTPLPADLQAKAKAAAALIASGDPAPPDAQQPGGTPAASTPTVSQGHTAGSGGTGSGAGAGSGTGAGASTDTPSSTGTPPITSVPPPKLAAVFPHSGGPSGKTPWDGIGFIRYTLPIAAVVGILAAIAARVLGRRRQDDDVTPPGAFMPLSDEPT